MRILFLTAYMLRGYGTSLVVAELARHLKSLGHFASVGCLRSDGHFQGLDLVETTPDVQSVRQLADDTQSTVVVAHTSPFFEVLPSLNREVDCWALEAGDPTPELFDADCAERCRIVRHKQQHVYGNLRGVMAISNFLRHEIQFPEAHVIPLGCDHMPYTGAKPDTAFTAKRKDELVIGTLARLGEGEARYKGFDELIALKTRLDKEGLAARFRVMGRGTDHDAARLLAHGIEVKLNATEEDKVAYLRDLDVFVSTSLWEGFNLPLVEAASQGTVAIAFDAGAHPEVTPLVVANRDDLFTLISAYATDKELLAKHSRLCHHYVWKKFRWGNTAQMLLDVVERNGPTKLGLPGGPASERP